MEEPYDLPFALRLDEHFNVEEALEVPREVVEELYSAQAFAWTRAHATHPKARHLTRQELVAALSPA